MGRIKGVGIEVVRIWGVTRFELGGGGVREGESGGPNPERLGKVVWVGVPSNVCVRRCRRRGCKCVSLKTQKF